MMITYLFLFVFSFPDLLARSLSTQTLASSRFLPSTNYLIIPYSLSHPLWTPEPVLFVFVSVLPQPDLSRPTTLLAQLLYTIIIRHVL